MDPYERAREIERELLEATRQVDEEERRMEEDSRRVGQRMREARERLAVRGGGREAGPSERAGPSSV